MASGNVQSAPAGSEYRCAGCGGTFLRTHSTDEALDASRELWGEIPAEGGAEVCDDCFRGLTAPVETI